MTQKPPAYATSSAIHERYYFVPSALPRATIYEYVRESNRGFEATVAFDYLDARISYGKFFRMVEKTAKALSASGIGEGDVVGVVMPTQPETFYIMYACSKLGAVACLIDLRYPRDYLMHAVETSGAKIVLASTATDAALADISDRLVMVAPGESVGIAQFATSKRVREAAKSSPQNLLKDRCRTWSEFIKSGQGSAVQNVPYAQNRTVVMVGTGGTTGIPKLVELSNDAINCAVFQCQHANFDFRRGDVWYDIMPPFIAYGVVDGLHLPLVMGMTVVLEPSPGVDALVAVLKEGRVNHMAASPSFYIDLVHRKDAQGIDMSQVRSPIVGGRGINVRQEQAINEMLARNGCQSYLRVGWGLTETCGAISVAGSSALVKAQSVGPTLTGGITAAFKVTEDADGAIGYLEMPLVPAGAENVSQEQAGELWYSGPNMMTGYFRNEEETASVLVDHDGRTWLRTGDVGYVDTEGSVFITNRIKDFIARKDGFKTPPKEIEDVLVLSGCVDEVAVVGIDDPAYEGNTLIAAFYTLEGEVGPDTAKATLRKTVEAKLAEYKHPDFYFQLDRMPYTPIGKIDRNALRARACEQASGKKAK